VSAPRCAPQDGVHVVVAGAVTMAQVRFFAPGPPLGVGTEVQSDAYEISSSFIVVDSRLLDLKVTP